jgi:hypothetical protein
MSGDRGALAIAGGEAPCEGGRRRRDVGRGEERCGVNCDPYSRACVRALFPLLTITIPIPNQPTAD